MSQAVVGPVRIERSEQDGELLASYVYLREPVRSHHTENMDDVLVVDRDAEGRIAGIEVLEFSETTLNVLNQLLRREGFAMVSLDDLVGVPSTVKSRSA